MCRNTVEVIKPRYMAEFNSFTPDVVAGKSESRTQIQEAGLWTVCGGVAEEGESLDAAIIRHPAANSRIM